MRALLIRVAALWRRSVGGVVAKILLLIASGLMCAIVAVIDPSIVCPNCTPKYLMVLFGVCMIFTIAGSVLIHNAVDWLIFMFNPLTFVYRL